MKELIAIQSELIAPKSQFNQFGKYKYRSCEDILESLKPLLKKYGCYLIMTDDIVQIGNGNYVKATVTLMGANEGVMVSAFAKEPDEQKGMSASQITGAASSYSRKCALSGLFCIDDNKDADSTNDHGKGEVSASNDIYRIGFGKFKGLTIDECDLGELQSYVDYLEATAKKQNKPIKGEVAEFIKKVEKASNA